MRVAFSLLLVLILIYICYHHRYPYCYCNIHTLTTAKRSDQCPSGSTWRRLPPVLKNVAPQGITALICSQPHHRERCKQGKNSMFMKAHASAKSNRPRPSCRPQTAPALLPCSDLVVGLAPHTDMRANISPALHMLDS